MEYSYATGKSGAALQLKPQRGLILLPGLCVPGKFTAHMIGAAK
jgi:hypothetical protein